MGLKSEVYLALELKYLAQKLKTLQPSDGLKERGIYLKIKNHE